LLLLAVLDCTQYTVAFIYEKAEGIERRFWIVELGGTEKKINERNTLK
jgi:hypothetical protein